MHVQVGGDMICDGSNSVTICAKIYTVSASGSLLLPSSMVFGHASKTIDIPDML